MRLLKLNDNGELSLIERSGYSIPEYAILSHTWGPDGEEVTYEDLMTGAGERKPGYDKIRFCGNQAKTDGLQYFWIDTCCIRKSSDSELSESINSMFRWYQRATKCYVHLWDVSTTEQKKGDEEARDTWEQAFRESRWFTRGWTLQELLAPTSVEFFSKEGNRIGDKQSLEQLIYEITGIPILALREFVLSQFSASQKLDWAKNRKTTREEDWAYSLLGICGISMPVLYGEGRTKAVRRLRKEIDDASKDKECLRHLYVTDPRADKIRIEETKGGLIPDSYHWILENCDFQQWRHDQQSHLLWIKGDPGKGKTMLLCGIVNELKMSIAETYLLSFFYCQATDSRINNATAVLRGLLYLLIDQQPSLILHIQKQHDLVGKNLFEDVNAWVALSDIFTNVLQDPSLKSTYLIIDALDECTEGLRKLLDFIIQKSSSSPHVKWLVSSRNWPPIEQQLNKAGSKVRLCLELNAESVSAAVSIYIQHTVCQLAQEKKYDDRTQDAVLEHLSSNANNTFLWVALVCQNLKNIPRGRIRARLSSFPPGLDSLYERMMKQICESEDSELYRRILGSIATVYVPITLTELTSLVEMLQESSDDVESLQEIIGLCGSFLTIREDVIYFVHQSAKDYLITKAFATIFPSGREETHYEIFSRSLHVMSRTLRRDIYDLRAPGYLIEQVRLPDPDPLEPLRYLCIYWVDHVCDWNLDCHADQRDLQDGGIVAVFIREKFLYWLEALSLCRSVPKGVFGMAKLEALIQRAGDRLALLELVRDARRFIMYHKQAIQIGPLQAYASALIFSPGGSLIRRHFKREEPKWITIMPTVGDKWSACLQTLEGHSNSVSSVAFSQDSTRLASASEDHIIKIWDASSGECLQTLKGHSSWIRSVAFSQDSTRLASASDDRTVKIWDPSNGECLQTLKGHSILVSSVAFSHDSTWLVSKSDHGTVKIWDASSGECLQTLKGLSGSVRSVTFSRLGSTSEDCTIKIWDASSGECLQTLKGHSSSVISVAFSHDLTRLASASHDSTTRIWDVGSGECLRTLKGDNPIGTSAGPYDSLVAFSHDSTRLASATFNRTIKIWDASSVECPQTLEGHSSLVRSVAFSYDSTRLASGSDDSKVKIWDASNGECLQTLEGDSISVSSVVFSYDSTRLASRTAHGTVKIWDASSGECLLTLGGYSEGISLIALSHDSTRLACVWWYGDTYDGTVRILDVSSGECLQTLKDPGISLAFSHDSTRLASASDNSTVKIWDISTGECLQTLKGHSSLVRSVAFSHNSTRLASASDDRTVKIWDASNGECLQTLSIGKALYNISFDTTGSYLRTAIGTVTVDAPSASNITPDQNLRFQGAGLSSDGMWITCNSENLVWLPSDYRPLCSAVSGRTIGIGVGSGKVLMCNFPGHQL